MKFKATWSLIAVFAALGTYLVLVEEPRRKAEGQAAPQETLVLPGFAPSRVTEISLEGARGRGRLVRGDGGRWAVVEPLADRADDGRVRGLLDDLKALTVEKEVAPAGADLKPFGLTAPEFVIRTRGSDATLAIGAENPNAEGRYLRAGNGPVQMAPAHLVEGLLQAPAELRSKDVLPSFPWNRLRSVAVSTPGAEPLRLAKGESGWRLAEPRAAEVDPDAAEALAEKLRWAKAVAFLDETVEGAAPRLAKGVTVTLTAEGEAAPSVVRLAEVDGQVWVAAGDRKALFSLPRDVLDAFRVKPQALERAKPVLTKTWSAESLAVTASGRTLSYERREGAWRRGSGIVRGEESARLQDLLLALEETGAVRVLAAPGAPAAYGLDEPRVTLTLSDSQQGRQALAVGVKGRAVFARAGAAGPVYEMPAEYLTRIEALGKGVEATAGAPAPGRKP